MLTGAAEDEPGVSGSLADGTGTRNTQQFIAGGAAALVQDSMGKPWSGDYVNATGDLIGDLTHNFFLETGARTTSSRSTRWSSIPPHAPSPATCSCEAGCTSRLRSRS